MVEKQCGYKTFIAPELMINNIAVLTQMYVTYNYCTAAYTTPSPWKLCADKAAAFAKDDVEDDDWKDWASIF